MSYIIWAIKYLQSLYAYGITPAYTHPADYLFIFGCINIHHLEWKKNGNGSNLFLQKWSQASKWDLMNYFYSDLKSLCWYRRQQFWELTLIVFVHVDLCEREFQNKPQCLWLRNLFLNVSSSVVSDCKLAFNEKFNLETGHFSKNRANGSILLRNSAGREATK